MSGQKDKHIKRQEDRKTKIQKRQKEEEKQRIDIRHEDSEESLIL